MIDLISRYWKADKALFVSVVLFIASLLVIVVSTIFSYYNLHVVQGQVSLIDIDAGKHTHLTIKLLNDSNRYYQQYENRFYDAAMNNVYKGGKVKFYTFSSQVRKPTPLLASKDQIGFNYYPIFILIKIMGCYSYFIFMLIILL